MELVVKYKGQEQVLQFEDKDVIFFPRGLVGFTDWRRFVLLEDPDEAPVAILQCVDDTEVSFLVTDPSYVTPDYVLELAPEDIRELGLANVERARSICILTIRQGPITVTANLLAPIVINSDTLVARQVIMERSQYSTRHPVLVARGKHGNRRARSLVAPCA